MILDKDWYVEQARGFAMGLKIKAKLHDEQSPYQRIEIYETETFGRLMTLDGLTMVTSRDNFIYHEMMSHPVLFTHAAPKRVVVVGGGDCGTLREVLKHPQVEEAILAELDERVTRVAEQFFPELCEANGDPRAKFNYGDAVKWIAAQPPDSLDVIIMDTTDPVGQAARLFEAEFYASCRRALRTGGIIVAQSESPLFDLKLMKRMHEEMRSAGFDAVQSYHFPLCTYPSGWWSATMACKDSPFEGFRWADAEAAAFATRYYDAAVHQAALALPRYVREHLRQ